MAEIIDLEVLRVIRKMKEEQDSYAQLVEQRLRLPRDLPVFQPEQRFALLVNAFSSKKVSPVNLDDISMRRIYEMEFALHGACDDILGVDLESVVYPYLEDTIEFRDELRRNTFYDRIKRIFVQEREHRKGVEFLPVSPLELAFNREITSFAELSTEKSLTFLYFLGHSYEGKLRLGYRDLAYDDLLRKLDTIQGKKVVTLFTGYSGKLISALEKWPKKEDYLALTLTQADEDAKLFASDSLTDQLVDLILHSEPLSCLDLTQNPYREQRTPQIRGYFDVRL